LLLVVSAPVDSFPDVVLVPDQAPEAVQDVAFVDDHVSSAAVPLTTLAGFALNVTVGSGGNTLTVTLLLVLPPAPVHASE